MRSIIHPVGGALILLACLGAWCGHASAATQRLILLHDNDIHGHLRSFCYVEVGRGPRSHCDVGGVARRATLVRRLRATADAPLLLVDAGDTTTRGPLATTYEGVDEIEAMNLLAYDMATVGNNEFKLKDGADAMDASGAQAALAVLVRRSRFPWLCANVTDANGAPISGVQPFVVRRIGHLRVAFIGLTAPRSSRYPQSRGLVIGDPIAAARVWIPRALGEADVVVAITHLGVADDRRLVAETRGIAAVIGGDSHTYLYAPLVVRNLDDEAVPIVQDGEFGVRLGELRLTFEGDARAGWHLAGFADRLIAVDASVRPDPRMAALVEKYAHPLDRWIGSMPRPAASASERRRATAEALARAWKAAAQTDVGLERESDTYASFDRSDVSRFILQTVLPFHETVWRGQLSGERLRQLLETPTAFGGAMRASIRAEDIVASDTYSVATTTFDAETAIPDGTDTGQDSRLAAQAWLATETRRSSEREAARVWSPPMPPAPATFPLAPASASTSAPRSHPR